MFTLYDDLTSFSKNITVKCEHEFFSPFYKVWTWKIPSFCCNFTSFCSFLQCEYCEIGNVSMEFSKSLVFDSWFGKHHTHISSSQYSLNTITCAGKGFVTPNKHDELPYSFYNGRIMIIINNEVCCLAAQCHAILCFYFQANNLVKVMGSNPGSLLKYFLL